MAKIPKSVQENIESVIESYSTEVAERISVFGAEEYQKGYIDSPSVRFIQTIDFDLLQQKAADYAREYQTPFLTDLQARDRKRVFGILSDVLEKGGTVSDFSTRLENTGILNPVRINRIFRTELSRFNNEGALQRYIDDGVPFKELIVTEPCKICAEIYSRTPIVPVDQPFYGGLMRPPFHPNCMCAILPRYDLPEGVRLPVPERIPKNIKDRYEKQEIKDQLGRFGTKKDQRARIKGALKDVGVDITDNELAELEKNPRFQDLIQDIKKRSVYHHTEDTSLISILKSGKIKPSPGYKEIRKNRVYFADGQAGAYGPVQISIKRQTLDQKYLVEWSPFDSGIYYLPDEEKFIKRNLTNDSYSLYEAVLEDRGIKPTSKYGDYDYAELRVNGEIDIEDIESITIFPSTLTIPKDRAEELLADIVEEYPFLEGKVFIG